MDWPASPPKRLSPHSDWLPGLKATSSFLIQQSTCIHIRNPDLPRRNVRLDHEALPPLRHKRWVRPPQPYDPGVTQLRPHPPCLDCGTGVKVARDRREATQPCTTRGQGGSSGGISPLPGQVNDRREPE